MSMLKVLAGHAKANPSKLAILDKAGRHSYGQLFSRVQQTADLIRTESGPGPVVMHLTDSDATHPVVQVSSANLI